MVGQNLKLIFSVFSLLTLGIEALDARSFVATSKHARLRRRDASFEPRMHGQSLVYGEYYPHVGDAPVSALRISLSPKKPMLILEDILPQLHGLECSEGYINVRLAQRDAFSGAHDAWHTTPNFYLVTSDPGCAPAGEHAVYDVAYSGKDESSNTILLTASKSTLRDSTHKMYFDLGDHIVPDVEPRVFGRDAQAEQPTTTTPPAIQSTEHVWATSISIAPPSATATTDAVSDDIGFNTTDTVLFPPPEAIVALVPQLDPIPGLQVSCVECSLTGSLDLRAAGFEVDSNDISQAFDFFNNGFFELRATGVAAKMQFAFDIAPEFATSIPVPFVPQLPALPLLPLGVPGVITFGPVLELQFPFSLTMSNPVRFTTGFTLNVPENSLLTLDVSSPSNSTGQGFQDSTLEMLPFDVNVDNLSMEISAGFQPRLLLAAGVGGDIPIVDLDIGGAIGVFFDLPQFLATVSLVENKADNCVDPAPANEQNVRVHIEPSVEVGAGVTWQLQALINDQGFSRQEDVRLVNATRTLPEQCLLFNREQGSVATTENNNNGGNGGSSPDTGAATVLQTSSKSMISLALAMIGLVMLI